MKVLFIASECSPIVKVGGLGDVVGSLPKSLKNLGIDVSIVIPFYKPIHLTNKKLIKENLKVSFAGQEKKFNLWQTTLPQTEIPVYLIENKEYLSSGGIYPEADASSGGSLAEAGRFLFFSKAAIEVGKLLKIDILHCQDWHTAIIPFLLKQNSQNKIKTILTIHNLGYQGIYSAQVANQLLGTNFSDEVNCLKLGILNADIITTVSSNYSKEILTKEFGFGLENYLKQRKDSLFGIVNGLDENIWNPEKDKYLIKPYSSKNLEGKTENKIYLQKSLFKKQDLSKPLFSIVSRLAQQKGIDLIIKIFPELIKKEAQFVLLGKGYLKYENFFRNIAKQYPEKVSANIEFNEKLAHQIYAGSDIFLMPSYFEPCGLGQLIAMKYGTVPVAHAVGGIKDTIKKSKVKSQKSKIIVVEGEGFLFERYDPKEFLEAIEEALEAYQNKEIWHKLQINGMNKDFSWHKSAKEYLKLYKFLA